MSIPVAVDDLPARLAELGDLAYLVTVGTERLAHVVSVRVEADGEGRLAMTVGRRTLANLAVQPTATLLWPPDAAREHSLIVDGTAELQPGSDGRLRLHPTKAVLHRLA
ncbi:MAG: pyridoxamine 5'-phosphate oxidase family protein [Actinomycetota bacterium]|nr:pyridoxamine 5'-phosphate oxidase family protein [Actinomycetota bacterium]